MTETLTLQLPQALTKQLEGLPGSSWSHKLRLLLKHHALIQIQEAESAIATFETKYSKTFAEFRSWWDSQAPEHEKHSYEVEKDYSEWEGWIGEREYWIDALKQL